tara:strand:- start:94 stop:774 length:681 start_codon:yes stop_codon:yes gene_type:complete
MIPELKARSLKINPCVASEVRPFIETNHYSKSINGVKITQCFKVEHLGKLVGAVLFGQLSTTAWKKFGKTEAEVLELRRLVLLDECGKNSESRVIGYCLRWLRNHLPHVKKIVSYADPMYGHDGVIYRASNFTMIGVTTDDKGFYDADTGKTYHSRAMRTKYKGDYKPFVKRLRAKLEAGLLVEKVLKGKFCYVYDLGTKKRSNNQNKCPDSPINVQTVIELSVYL